MSESRGAAPRSRERKHRILIADDDESIIQVLQRVLEREGLGEVHSTVDSRRVLPLFFECRPDMVFLDVQMPRLDGLAVLRQIRGRVTEGEYLPVMVMTGNLDPTLRIEALRSGATDFLNKPFDLQEVALRVQQALWTRDLTVSLEDRITERTQRIRDAELEAVRRLGMLAELRDYADGNHPKRVGDHAATIAAEMGFSDDQVELVRRAAPLHDIGKIAIPESILLKPGALTLDELEVMKSHTTIGSRLVGDSAAPLFQLAEEIALYHHENWDGTGYTPGLAGEAIPIMARIVAVTDVFDALTHERPYKKAWTWEDASGWISEQAGQKFDPAVVDAFKATLDVRLPSS